MTIRQISAILLCGASLMWAVGVYGYDDDFTSDEYLVLTPLLKGHRQRDTIHQDGDRVRANVAWSPDETYSSLGLKQEGDKLVLYGKDPDSWAGSVLTQGTGGWQKISDDVSIEAGGLKVSTAEGILTVPLREEASRVLSGGDLSSAPISAKNRYIETVGAKVSADSAVSVAQQTVSDMGQYGAGASGEAEKMLSATQKMADGAAKDVDSAAAAALKAGSATGGEAAAEVTPTVDTGAAAAPASVPAATEGAAETGGSGFGNFVGGYLEDIEGEGVYSTLKLPDGSFAITDATGNVLATGQADAEGNILTIKESSGNVSGGNFDNIQEGTGTEYKVDSENKLEGTNRTVEQFLSDPSYTTPKIELPKSTSLTEDNVNILGFDNVFGERSIWKADASKQPTLNSDGTITITSAQTDQLHNAFGVWVNSSGNVVSDGTALGQATVTAMQSAKTFQTDLKNLQSASAAVSTAETNVRIAQADLDRSPNSESAKKALTEAKQELSDAQANQTAAEVPVNQHIQNLENVKTEARNSLNDTLNSYHEVGPNAEGFEYNAFKVGLNNDLDAGNYNAANGRIDQALKDGLITEDQANTLKNKVAGIETADGNLNEAKEAKNESTNTQVSIREVNAVDVARIVLEVLAVTEAENDLSIQEDINIKAGEIGEAVGAVDETVLATDTGEDASSASTIVNAAATVKSLLQAAVVDLGLLSEDVSTSEGDTAISSDIGGLAVMESQTGNLSEVTTNNDNGGNDNTTDPVVEAKRKVIEQRREDLMGQYAAAAIQVAEGMNAISNKFFDRANVLVSFSTNIQTESAAFGLAQDTGRYVLLEALRNVALSSIQMGVQATRLLNEQTVEVSSDDN